LNRHRQKLGELFAQRRENALHRWNTSWRSFRFAYVLFLVVLLVAIGGSGLLAFEIVTSTEPEPVLLAGIGVYCLFVPFLLSMLIPLISRNFSKEARQEIWTTAMTRREVAFGLLLGPALATLAIVAVYPVLFILTVILAWPEQIRSMVQAAAERGEFFRSVVLSTCFFGSLYLLYCTAAAHLPLLSRIRSFRIPWSPTLAAPFWAWGHFIGVAAALVMVSLPYTEMLSVLMEPGQPRYDMETYISLFIMVSACGFSIWATWKSLTARAGIRWFGDAVPHVAAEADWFFHDRAYQEMSSEERIAVWKHFATEAWWWWRSRLKWAAFGLLMSLTPMTAGLVTRGWGDYRSLEWGGLFMMPFMIPAIVFLPSMFWKSGNHPPIMRHRLLLSSLLLFLPCALFCVVGALLGLMLQEGFLLFGFGGLPWAALLLTILSGFFVLPCYMIWLALMPAQGRPRLIIGVIALWLLHAPAAYGIWNWATLAVVAAVSFILALAISSSMLGSISMLLQRCHVLEKTEARRESENKTRELLVGGTHPVEASDATGRKDL